MRIRPFKEKDAPAVSRIFHSAVHNIARLHYSAEQIEAWSPEIPPPEIMLARSKDGRVLLVATDDQDQPLAYGDLERDGHIDHLYCRPDVAGTGVTSALYDALEAEARKLSIASLNVEASEPARRFFLRKGFNLLHRRELEIAGVLIHNFAMEKRL